MAPAFDGERRPKQGAEPEPDTDATTVENQADREERVRGDDRGAYGNRRHDGAPRRPREQRLGHHYDEAGRPDRTRSTGHQERCCGPGDTHAPGGLCFAPNPTLCRIVARRAVHAAKLYSGGASFNSRWHHSSLGLAVEDGNQSSALELVRDQHRASDSDPRARARRPAPACCKRRKPEARAKSAVCAP